MTVRRSGRVGFKGYWEQLTSEHFLRGEFWTHGGFYGWRGTYFSDVTADGRADAIAVNDAA